ncbi:hypothetical protein CCACVL1_22555 [Corchorus capsularis]|uniref:Uncharacterized protein n=1 Tax=Corchorus capsularis TaxID=210143 RepID=A0A1R3GY82_COCAP|nr:hypothetical protein CCACVL1_22555 [Corchorus capsularis]
MGPHPPPLQMRHSSMFNQLSPSVTGALHFVGL